MLRLVPGAVSLQIWDVYTKCIDKALKQRKQEKENVQVRGWGRRQDTGGAWASLA